MTRQDRNSLAGFLATILTIAVTIGGIVWALSAQNQKLEAGCKDIEAVKLKVERHDRSITTIETKLDYIIKGVDELKKK